MNRIVLAALAAALVAAAGNASAQQGPDFSKTVMKTTDLGHHIYRIEGEGGNITAAVAADGVLVVDGEFAPLHDKIKAAVAQVTNLPIRYLVNTHMHGDHTGGNAGFATEGTIIVAHEAVKDRLMAGTTNGLTGVKTPPAPPAALPTKIYKTSMTLRLKGLTAQLHHVANAHTDGDTYVWFPDANVLSTGDIFSLQRYPNIDFANGGNIRGMIAGTDTYLKLVNDQTKIVTGHGSLATKADLVAYRAMLITARDRMNKLIAQGKSEADIIAAKPYADFDAKIGVDQQASTNFIRVVYASLKRKA
jgi:glyoxylase-like metal-dependent hydrolase (beta-lactamase superfamily II)